MHNPMPSQGAAALSLFCLHCLGGSAREWQGVERELGAGISLVGIDLPGFGSAADMPGYSVAAMAEHVAAQVRAAAPGRWMLAGHSMGAKVAAVVARQAVAGAAGLEGLCGLVLLAGSPPGPEPMSEERRADMTGWLDGDAAHRATQAREFVAANAVTLTPEARAAAEVDVLRANPAAWRAWLQSGSREDWAERVGVLPLPALILAGAEDGDLGPEAQRRLMAPHVLTAEHHDLPHARHLLPIEAASTVARLITRFAALPPGETQPPRIPPHYRALLESGRTSTALRDALLARAAPEADARRAWLPAGAYAVLEAALDRVIPQSPHARIDLAARIERSLAEDAGDGWRFADLPADAEAMHQALLSLDALGRLLHQDGFTGLTDAGRDTLLHRVADGQAAAAAPGLFDGSQMALWFQDLRAMAVKHYVGHPATLARMGYSGVASGGDGPRKSGFTRFGIGEREAWEPVALAGEAP